jgi:uncharacterized protein YbgA (DUF1722 family)/uncharacterized protein YbbK (DUF523 family)
MKFGKPVIGIGACLVGQKVRYNGVAKRKNRHIQDIAAQSTLNAFCPEMAIGLGVPRETVRLVGTLGQTRLKDSATQSLDYTDPMRANAEEVVSRNPNMSGYILVKDSPSCGMDRVKRYNDKGNVVFNDAMGIFAAAIAALDPLLPLEEDGRLHDAGLRENFVTRVFAYHDWKQFRQDPLTYGGLLQFWARYKYLALSHDAPTYKAIGRLLSNAKARALNNTAEEFIGLLMGALKKLATRKTHTNVLQHLKGYLKNDIESRDKQEIDTVITQYREGTVPLVVPITLLRHHFMHHSNSYIAQQVYMEPYPQQLSLRNYI